MSAPFNTLLGDELIKNARSSDVASDFAREEAQQMVSADSCALCSTVPPSPTFPHELLFPALGSSMPPIPSWPLFHGAIEPLLYEVLCQPPELEPVDK